MKTILILALALALQLNCVPKTRKYCMRPPDVIPGYVEPGNVRT